MTKIDENGHSEVAIDQTYKLNQEIQPNHKKVNRFITSYNLRFILTNY